MMKRESPRDGQNAGQLIPNVRSTIGRANHVKEMDNINIIIINNMWNKEEE